MSDNQAGGRMDPEELKARGGRTARSTSFPRVSSGTSHTEPSHHDGFTPPEAMPESDFEGLGHGDHLGRRERFVTDERAASAPVADVKLRAQPAVQPPRRNPRARPSVPRARRMKLSITRVDPWSVTKISFLLAIAGAIIQVVAIALVWLLLNSIGMFDTVAQIFSQTGLDTGSFNLNNVLNLGTVLSATTIFSTFEVVLVVVLSTIVAFLYNVVSALVGGIHVTLGDD